MNNYIWSLDISTTNIGFALWDVNGKLVELKHLVLKINKEIPVENRLIHKAEVFKSYVTEFKKRIENDLNGRIVEVIVEEPLGGSSNPHTAAILFGFNGICRYLLYRIFNIQPIMISVYDSRKIFCDELIVKKKSKGKIIETLTFPDEYKKNKKLYIWEKVSKLEPQIEWFYKKGSTTEPRDICFDMSDSYAVGFAGLKRLGVI